MKQVPGEYVARLDGARKQKGISVDELARLSGYPADLLRPLLAGEPPDGGISEHMNGELCEVLGLDAGEMWQSARRGGLQSET